MKLKALALIGLVALAPAALAQSECSTAKKECSSAKAELAKAGEGECSQKAKTECSSAKAELAKAGEGECSQKAKTECSSAKAELAKAGEGECSQKAKADCSSAKAELAKAGEGECSDKAKAECSSAKGELAKAGEGECSDKAKAECSSAKGELAKAGEGECSDKAKASLVTAKDECCGSGELAKAGEGACSSEAKADCSSTLASAGDGDCSQKKAECSSGEALVTAGTSECSKAATVVPASAQLFATLIRSDRVAGVVIDGKAYLGKKAMAKIHGLVKADLATKIKANCEESAACEKTLASNVEKAMNGPVCMKSELTGMLAAGRIDSLIIDDESLTCSKTAEATLAKITSCEEFQAECRERAGAKTAPVKTASFEPVSIDSQLAALVGAGRVEGIVVDGKAYQGCEAGPVLAKLIRTSLATDIKSKCEKSAACEKTLASNVEKAMGGSCATTQLASLLESGKIQSVLVGGTMLKSCEAKAALVKLTSCEQYQAECRELASAKAETCETKAACSTTLQ